jgi:putative hydroxymethylpyrimidine transporter CytX
VNGVAERIDTTTWGLDPVPQEHRRLTAIDHAVLWGDLGIGVLVLVVGALLVPGLGFWTAMAAVAIGSVIGVGLLALGSAAGARHGVPTMVLFRPSLGIRGSWFPSALNVVQLVGWTAVEFWAMSYVADIVAMEAFGFSARWLWLSVAVVACTLLALWGPVGVTRVYLERFGAWIVVAISAAVTALVMTQDGIGAALSAPGAGGFPSFGVAIDLVIAMPVSWLPLVADYSRFGTSARGAFWGTFAGYLIANVWLYALGAMLVLGAGAQASPSGIAAGILAIAGGSVAGFIFLAGLLVVETDEAFADIYSGALSLQNIFPRASQRALILGIAGVGAILAGVFTMELYESFLLWIGSVFLPLFGILAGFQLRNPRHQISTESIEISGPYWYRGGFNLRALGPFLAGFVVYHWISPSALDWWYDLVISLAGTPLSERYGWLGGSLPAFLVSFLLTVAFTGRITSSSHSEKGRI